ncbi:MAG: sigma-70 family RNA polymerase sigma factor [Bacteroidetes bacterium]|nr:sigma-70 family RNA polymerase sigma factor [Bacteroidota bacterium]MCH8523269.1 sigma-70 family RNA polymerase sigma factor [Balneolales bacterium]
MSSSNTSDHNTESAGPSASSRADLLLVERAQGGDQLAFKALFDKYRQPLYYHILKMVHRDDVIEDLQQEIFLKAFDNIHSYNTGFAFSTWLYRITTNHTIDFLRKKRLQTTSIDDPVKTKDGEMRVDVEDEDASSDEAVIQKQRQKIIRDALQTLPEKYRMVIQYRHMEELSYQEIAELMDLPLGTVKAHIFRAREMLYKYLKDRQGSF